jgi:hypothetical protein
MPVDDDVYEIELKIEPLRRTHLTPVAGTETCDSCTCTESQDSCGCGDTTDTNTCGEAC